MDANSEAAMRIYMFLWKFLGLVDLEHINVYLRYAYDIFITIFATIGFPLHLMLGAFTSTTQDDFFANLVIGVAAVGCSIKHFIYRRKMRKMHQVMTLLKQLDAQVKHAEERSHFRDEMWLKTQLMTWVMTFLFGSVLITAAASPFAGLVLGRRILMYPAYMPLDWRNSRVAFAGALAFQVIGLFVQVVQNITNDLYGPLVFCLFAGHVRLLAIRIAKVGYAEDKQPEQHNEELIECIKDKKLLMDIFALVQDIISLSYLTQFSAVGINLCAAIVYLLLIADNMFAYAYYSVCIVAIAIELFPCCYYGTQLEYEFRELPYAMFSSNWPMQSRTFRRNIVTLCEQSQPEVSLYAGGMVKIHLDSFIATAKMAYSFFTVIQSMN